MMDAKRSGPRAQVFVGDHLAGWLQEDEEGYLFQYDAEYLHSSCICKMAADGLLL